MPWQKIKRGLKKDDSLGDGGLTDHMLLPSMLRLPTTMFFLLAETKISYSCFISYFNKPR